MDPQGCGIGGIGSVSPATARRLACDAMIQTITYNTDGHVLNFGRAKRFVTKAQRRALLARDWCCQFPGCGRTRRLDAHHIVHWAFGGPSDLDNYVLLCAHHHTLVHEASLTIIQTPLRDLNAASWVAGDQWTFTRIGGQTITAEQTTGVPAGAQGTTVTLETIPLQQELPVDPGSRRTGRYAT